ncbi:MAG: cell division topological specificity factor MinE [Selenomonadaceae bacterium]|nr:cell division topological specificity factor MinE [Selenomonadaceae bacterium]
MLDALMKIFGKNEKSSRQIAKDRLQVVLVHDRASISPKLMEQMQNEIIHVVSKYMEIDRRSVEISLADDTDSVALVANIPVNKMKHG